MQEKVAIKSSSILYNEAINYAAKTLASELDIIELENYSIGLEEYQIMLEAAKDKFGDFQHNIDLMCLLLLYTPYNQAKSAFGKWADL